MSIEGPILVTGAAGRMGGVGGAVVEMLRQCNLPVRALVRRDDERADALRAQANGCCQHQVGAVRFEQVDGADFSLKALGD